MKLVMGAAGQGKTRYMLELAIKLSKEGHNNIFITIGEEESLFGIYKRLQGMHGGSLDGLRVVINSYKGLEKMVLGAVREGGKNGITSYILIDGKKLNPEELNDLLKLEEEYKDLRIYVTAQTNRSLSPSELTIIDYIKPKDEEK
jgi:hypothetical protein